MGSGIARIAADAGHPVRIYDAEASAARAVTHPEGLIQPAERLRDLHDCALVIEAVVEDLHVKRELFSELVVVDDERTAFAAQVKALGAGTTLLVDTFDVEQGIRAAIDVAGPDLGAIRLDSGDLLDEARRARARLDRLGATRTKIVASGDLDEREIGRLAAAPVDAYGVGTALVTGSGAPTAELVYKLVARGDAPVSKRSRGKETTGGRKWAYRLLDAGGRAREERILTAPAPDGRPLQVPVLRGGEAVHRPSLAEIREHHAEALAELPSEALLLEPGPPALRG